jgi:hypothetical protein
LLETLHGINTENLKIMLPVTFFGIYLLILICVFKGVIFSQTIACVNSAYNPRGIRSQWDVPISTVSSLSVIKGILLRCLQAVATLEWNQLNVHKDL